MRTWSQQTNKISKGKETNVKGINYAPSRVSTAWWASREKKRTKLACSRRNTLGLRINCGQYIVQSVITDQNEIKKREICMLIKMAQITQFLNTLTLSTNH